MKCTPQQPSKQRNSITFALSNPKEILAVAKSNIYFRPLPASGKTKFKSAEKPPNKIGGFFI